MPDLPVVGKVPKGWVIAVGGISVAILGYAWWKHHKASSPNTGTAPAAGAAGSDPYPPDGTTGNPADPYSTDPATGMTYGDEQQGSYGYGYGGGYGGYGGGTGGGSGGGSGSGGFTTNAQWAQQAETDLTNYGVNPTTLAAALGKYLTAQPLTSDQQSLVDQAIALEGYPPVAGPDGKHPPAMVTGGGGGGNATNPVTGLHVTQRGETGSDIAWNPAAGATGYQVTSTKGTVTMLGATSARVHGISTRGDAADQATVTVLAQPAASGAQPATIVVHTRR